MNHFAVPSLAALVLGGSMPAAGVRSEQDVTAYDDSRPHRVAYQHSSEAGSAQADCPYAEVDARSADSPYQEIGVPHVPYSHGVIYRGWDAIDLLAELVGTVTPRAS
jgi:hypothetical protein